MKARKLMLGLSMYHYSEESTSEEQFHTGLLQIDTILKEGDRLKSPVYFLSGPPTMIDVFQKDHISAEVLNCGI